MSLPRIVLSIAMAIAVLLASLAPRGSAPEPTIPARELLTLAQRLNAANYTFDRATSEALATVTVPRPAEDADLANLESSLRAAGFQWRPVGPETKRIFLVERARG